MRNRGDISISMTSIIWLIIAVVVLGLLITLMAKSFSSIDDQLAREAGKLDDPPRPSGQEPVTATLPLSVTPGESFVIKISVFAAQSDINGVTAILLCTDSAGASILPATAARLTFRDIAQGSTETFYYGNSVLETTAPGRYLCELKAGGQDPANAVVEFSTQVSLQVVG